VTEEWRDIDDGTYEISDAGNVRRGDRGTLLKPFTSSAGYLIATLSVRGITSKHLVHRLVAHAFLGHSDLQVNHIDGDKSNNAISNLEYVTQHQNMQHAVRTGLATPPSPVLDYNGKHWTTLNPERVRGEANHRAKLTEHDVRRMRALRPTATLSVLSRQFNVSLSLVQAICSGKAWSHIQ
jgi:hypothetical protein